MGPSEPDQTKAHQKAIGARIRAIRGQRSQRVFATLLDSTQGYISDLERGRCFPSVAFLTRLKDLSGRSYHWFLTGQEGHEHGGAAEPSHVVHAHDQPELYRLISALEDASPTERERFFQLARSFFRQSS